MKPLIRTLSMLLAACLLVAVLAPAAFADAWDKKTVITVRETVQVPGAVLQPGTYVIKLFNSLADRHIVQIFNEDETKVIATILAIPNWRLEPKEKTTLQYWETRVNEPRALRAWFYPGDNFGQEFAYSKQKSQEIAAQVHEPVPAFTLPEGKPLEQAVLEPAPAVEPPRPEPAVETWAPAPEPAPEPAPAPEQAPAKELPKTAGPLPLIALCGLLALGSGALLGHYTRS